MRVSRHGQLAEAHPEPVIEEEASRKGFARAQDELDCFHGFDGADEGGRGAG